MQLVTLILAEREGFEPPVPCSTPVFKTGAFDHSAISPSKLWSSFRVCECKDTQCLAICQIFTEFFIADCSLSRTDVQCVRLKSAFLPVKLIKNATSNGSDASRVGKRCSYYLAEFVLPTFLCPSLSRRGTRRPPLVVAFCA